MFDITVLETNIKRHSHRDLSGVQETHLVDPTNGDILGDFSTLSCVNIIFEQITTSWISNLRGIIKTRNE
jgi:hypothetical protein